MSAEKEKRKTILSREELIKFSEEHLYYEMWMLISIEKELRTAIQGTPKCNAFLESFVIHAAILIEFFYNKGNHPDIARASDYIMNGQEWQESIPPYKRYSDLIRNRRNAEMAHLSYKRLSVLPEKKPWRIDLIALQLRVLFNQFLENANPQLLHPKLYTLKMELSNSPPGFTHHAE